MYPLLYQREHLNFNIHCDFCLIKIPNQSPIMEPKQYLDSLLNLGVFPAPKYLSLIAFCTQDCSFPGN